MNRIEQQFQTLRENGSKALMPFVVAGHPEPESLPQLLLALQGGGASVVEIGIPFSDPIADGPVIAAAMHDALERGTTPEQVFEQVRSVRGELEIGLVAMVSISIANRFGGPEEFVRFAVDAGFDGFIFPDAPFEEAQKLIEITREAGATLSLLVSPSTPDHRAAEIAKACIGFVYLVARAGITGESEGTPEVEARVRVIREATETPIACGFGISNAEQVRAVVEHADAAIVGSALVRRLTESGIEQAEQLTRELTDGLS